jgi:hypothetical protein
MKWSLTIKRWAGIFVFLQIGLSPLVFAASPKQGMKAANSKRSATAPAKKQKAKEFIPLPPKKTVTYKTSKTRSASGLGKEGMRLPTSVAKAKSGTRSRSSGKSSLAGSGSQAVDPADLAMAFLGGYDPSRMARGDNLDISEMDSLAMQEAKDGGVTRVRKDRSRLTKRDPIEKESF